MRIVSRVSPNYNRRPEGMVIDTIVLHATESSDCQQDVAWLCNPASQASAHVVIDRDGTVYDLVAPERRAWHAGYSRFMARDDVNDFSIGIEFANRCDGQEAFPDVQLQVGAALVAEYMKRFPAITLERITTHRFVRELWLAMHPGTAPMKPDPGPCFDVARFLRLVSIELVVGA